MNNGSLFASILEEINFVIPTDFKQDNFGAILGNNNQVVSQVHFLILIGKE